MSKSESIGSGALVIGSLVGAIALFLAGSFAGASLFLQPPTSGSLRLAAFLTACSATVGAAGPFLLWRRHRAWGWLAFAIAIVIVLGARALAFLLRA